MGIERDLGDFPDLDAVEVDFTAIGDAAHGALERDDVVVELLVQPELGQPDDEDDPGDQQDRRDHAHQGIVGVALHQCAPAPWAAAAARASAEARPLVPRKYSRIQGWSDCSSSWTGAMATTFLSARTAT